MSNTVNYNSQSKKLLETKQYTSTSTLLYENIFKDYSKSTTENEYIDKNETDLKSILNNPRQYYLESITNNSEKTGAEKINTTKLLDWQEIMSNQQTESKKAEIQSSKKIEIEYKKNQDFKMPPRKKDEFVLEDYQDMSIDYYKKLYGDYLSNEEIEYLITIQSSYLENAKYYQDNIEFWTKLKNSIHSENYLYGNQYRLDFDYEYFENWLTQMDKKYHADWYAEPEKYASQIKELEDSRKERMQNYAGGIPSNIAESYLMQLYADNYKFENGVDIYGTSEESKAGYNEVKAKVDEYLKNTKGIDEYCMENYGCDSEAFYYYGMTAQIHGSEIIEQYNQALYEVKQNIDKLAYGMMECSEDFQNSKVDTRFNYPTNFEDLINDYEKSWNWNKSILQEKYGVSSEDEWEAFKLLSFMEPSERKLYFYLLDDGKQELANDLLVSSYDDATRKIAGINTINKMVDNGIIKIIDANGNKYDFNNYELTNAPIDVINNYWQSILGGSKDGIVQWAEGIYNIFAADGLKSENEYERMYFVQMLSTGKGVQSCLDETYQISNAVGNMLPTVLISGAITYSTAGTGSEAAGALISKALAEISLAGSTFGNSMEQFLQEYDSSYYEAGVYGLCMAGIEGVTEAFGSVVPIADQRATNFMEAFLREGTEEGVQSLIEAGINYGFKRENVSMEDIIKESAQSFIIGGTVGSMYYYPNTLISAMTISKQSGIPLENVISTYQAYAIAANNNSNLTYENFVKNLDQNAAYAELLKTINENPNLNYDETIKTYIRNVEKNSNINMKTAVDMLYDKNNLKALNEIYNHSNLEVKQYIKTLIIPDAEELIKEYNSQMSEENKKALDSIFNNATLKALGMFNAFFKNFREHGILHTNEVASYAIVSAVDLQTSGVKIDTMETYYGALFHDLGMQGGISAEFMDGKWEFKAIDEENYPKAWKRSTTARKNHPLNSAIEILTSDVVPSEIDKDIVAILAMSHSKSTSGIQHFSSKDEWNTCIDKLEAAMKYYNKTNGTNYSFDAEKLRKIINEGGDDFKRLQYEALCIREGDAMSIVPLTENGDTIMQTGQVSHIEYSGKAKLADNYTEVPAEEIPAELQKQIREIRNNKNLTKGEIKDAIDDLLSDSKIYGPNVESNGIDDKIYNSDGTPYIEDGKQVIVDNNTSKRIHAGELNVSFDSKITATKYSGQVEILDPTITPYSTIDAIFERIAEVATYDNMKYRNFEIIFPKELEGTPLGEWYENKIHNKIDKTIDEFTKNKDNSKANFYNSNIEVVYK